VELEPSNTGARNDLVILLALCPHFELRDGSRAVAVARKGLALAPDDALCLQALGWALYRNGNWKDSIDAFRKSIALQGWHLGGGYRRQWLGLAVDYMHLDNKEEARRWFSQSLDWMENDPKAGENWGLFMADVGDVLKDEMIAKAWVHANLAEEMRSKGKPDE